MSSVGKWENRDSASNGIIKGWQSVGESSRWPRIYTYPERTKSSTNGYVNFRVATRSQGRWYDQDNEKKKIIMKKKKKKNKTIRSDKFRLSGVLSSLIASLVYTTTAHSYLFSVLGPTRRKKINILSDRWSSGKTSMSETASNDRGDRGRGSRVVRYFLHHHQLSHVS